MLSKAMMQEIQDLKLRGFTVKEISEHLKARDGKAPSMPTIRKYYAMDIIPDDPGALLSKDKAFGQEPFHSAVVEVLRNNENNPKLCISSVYDVLEERFIENGEFDELPGNPQTLRNYVRYLREHNIVAQTQKNTRIYDHVFDTPPGEKMLIDFGQQRISSSLEIHFICLLLRYSRFLVVYAQDHKFNSEEACKAIFQSFQRIGGRPRQLVIDQDAVFIADET